MKRKIKNNADRDDFIEYVKGKEIKTAHIAEFSQIRRKRSLSANAYLWLLLTIEQEYTGMDKGDVYIFYLAKFPTFKRVEKEDEILLCPITSSGFDSLQMATFIDSVRREMAMNGIATPDPDKAMEVFEYYSSKGLI